MIIAVKPRTARKIAVKVNPRAAKVLGFIVSYISTDTFTLDILLQNYFRAIQLIVFQFYIKKIG